MSDTSGHDRRMGANIAELMGEMPGRLNAMDRRFDEHYAANLRMVEDIKIIRSTMDQAKGGWKTLLLIGGVAGAMGAFVTKMAAFVGTLPR